MPRQKLDGDPEDALRVLEGVMRSNLKKGENKIKVRMVRKTKWKNTKCKVAVYRSCSLPWSVSLQLLIRVEGGNGGRHSPYFRLLNAAFAGHIATQYKQPSLEEGVDFFSHQCKHNINIEDSRKWVKKSSVSSIFVMVKVLACLWTGPRGSPRP